MHLAALAVIILTIISNSERLFGCEGSPITDDINVVNCPARKNKMYSKDQNRVDGSKM